MSQDDFIHYLEELNEEENLEEIRAAEKKRRESNKRSELKNELMERIHSFDAEDECKRSVRLCLVAVAVAHSDEKTYKKIIQLLQKPLRALTEPNLDIVDQIFTEANNAYKKKFGAKSPQHILSKKTLHLTAEEKQLRNKDASLRRVEKNTNPVEIMDTEVYRLILKGQEITADWKDKFIAIALSCGSRLIEIASPGVSKFSESVDAPGQLHQDGVAKDEHGTKVRGDERHIDKPIIKLTVQELLTMIKEARELLREEKKNVPHLFDLLDQKGKVSAEQKKTITASINASVNERVREVMGKAFHFHTLRAIYGNMSHQLFGSNMSINVWISRVLGHKPGSMSTAASYTTVVISKHLPQESTDFKNQITELTQDVSVLKAEMAKTRKEILTEAEQAVEKRMRILKQVDGVGLLNEEGKEMLFRRQPPIHDGKQMERLLRSVSELEEKKVRVHWPNLRKLGYDDKVITDYFKATKDAAIEGLPDQRRVNTSKKRKLEGVEQ